MSEQNHRNKGVRYTGTQKGNSSKTNIIDTTSGAKNHTAKVRSIYEESN